MLFPGASAAHSRTCRLNVNNVLPVKLKDVNRINDTFEIFQKVILQILDLLTGLTKTAVIKQNAKN